MKRFSVFLCLLFVFSAGAWAEPNITLVTSSPTESGGQEYSVTLKILLFMTLLTFLPAIVMMMTSFTRIVIVLSILKQALGTQQVPSSQIIIGLSLFLSLFIMMPVLERTYTDAIEPYLNEKISGEEAMAKAQIPIRKFMMEQTREADLALFSGFANKEQYKSPDEIPLSILVPSFVTSELKTAFQIGFLIFVPFVVIDLVVASILMSMGMMMLSPMLISLPFKLMLFVLVDGWSLIMTTLVASFAI
ncbi:MAG: flagellar type III secretion system pore protein FliP [Gammaproteobacteria bacterium]|nr:flagellar type III secretion system pore protein FliP [Gammaproteobacteria bacterium]